MKHAKTNAARLLDTLKITYDLAEYEPDENDLSAVHMAQQIGVDIRFVYKTLVCKGNKTGHVVCVIPGGSELDLKKAAKASGNKECSMLPLKDLTPATGYIRGGCSPLAMKKKYPTFIDDSVLELDRIHVSAGVRGLQLVLAPADLIRAAEATPCPLIREQ